MTIRPELLDELLKDFTKTEDLVGERGILKQLTNALVEHCLETEMDVHLDNPKYKTEKKPGATVATDILRRRLRVSSVKRRSTFPVTAMENLNQSCSRRDRPVLTALTAKSSRSVVRARRPETSKRNSRICMEWKSQRL
jgi:transposase-like protein